MPEAIIAALGAAAIGAVWSSCSPDFGVQGVLDRFGQIEPRVLVTADGYFYAGKVHDVRPKLAAILEHLPTVERVVVVPYVEESPDLTALRDAVPWGDFTVAADAEPAFEPLPFNHPLYILYSSGTTGPPKCIVHGAGGTLIQHLKEHQLHCDVRPGDRVFYFTTCGWMMWNWLVTALASEATLVLYDGSPFHPDGNALFDLADETGVTLFGTSARSSTRSARPASTPARTHRLGDRADDHLHRIASGARELRLRVSAREGRRAPRVDLRRHRHRELLRRRQPDSSGLARRDPGAGARHAGRGLRRIRAGGPRGEGRARLHDAVSLDAARLLERPGRAPLSRRIFRACIRASGITATGCELTGHGGFIIYGRSDAVLNPGGVRIGTAEIYRQVEQLDEVARERRHRAAMGE